MEERLAEFLFLHKQCPLPKVGSLQLVESPAVSVHTDNKISAPKVSITFTRDEVSMNNLVRFLADSAHSTEEQAARTLEQFCYRLRSLKPYEEQSVPFTGKFYVDSSGMLSFKPQQVAAEFLPSVAVSRISHARPVSHDLRVGDKYSTSEEMTEFLSARDTSRRDLWWVWALVFVAIAAVGLIIYFNQHEAGRFGNTKEVEPKESPATYRDR